MIGTTLEFFNSFGIGGLFILVFIFMFFWFIKEKIYYIPNISGKWEMKLIYLETEYNPYLNMEVKYYIFINQSKGVLSAKGEKFFESLQSSITKRYEGKEKTFSEYDGFIYRSFNNNDILLDIKETAQERIVAGRINLKVISPNYELRGTFDRLDANSKGIVILNKINE